MTSASAPPSSLLKAVVAATPLAGSLLVPVLVPLLMVRVSIAAGVLAVVALGSLWFVAMLRTSEMPPHPEHH
ncbi:MAG: hypothetical protein VKN56_00755 [Cyanobacteriota bacterium]|jgi:hypothetical protein|nr:hypothetical protein [Cyanobacteriota bacterium]